MRDTIRMIRFLPLASALLALSLCSAAEAAKPAVCRKGKIERAIKAAGHSADAGVFTIRCGDLTNDGSKDALFNVLSGGTAGTTHFGVLRSTGDLILYESGYKVGVARVNDHRFAVQQPYYKADDANCCPSAFDITPYRWNGATFKAGKSRRNQKPQKRFS